MWREKKEGKGRRASMHVNYVRSYGEGDQIREIRHQKFE